MRLANVLSQQDEEKWRERCKKKERVRPTLSMSRKGLDIRVRYTPHQKKMNDCRFALFVGSIRPHTLLSNPTLGTRAFGKRDRRRCSITRRLFVTTPRPITFAHVNLPTHIFQQPIRLVDHVLPDCTLRPQLVVMHLELSERQCGGCHTAGRARVWRGWRRVVWRICMCVFRTRIV